MKSTTFDSQYLRLFGAQENNLKNLTCALKHDSFIVVTGVSGSGKSTLAIDTIYAEGGRRYIETFSPYTRQFLDRLHQPKLDGITGVRPALALEQRNRVTSSRSTVGTATEINDYLKVIWASLAEVYCPKCKQPVEHDTPIVTLKKLFALAKKEKSSTLLVTFPLPLNGEASARSLVSTLQSEGFTRFYSPDSGAVSRLEELSEEDLGRKRELMIIVDRILTPESAELPDLRERILSSINQAFSYGHGQLTAVLQSDSKKAKVVSFSEALVCNTCGTRCSAPKPYMFSFNSPLGACATCHGFGKILTFDPDLCIPNPNISINEGAIVCWDSDSRKKELKKLKAFCEEVGIDPDLPWSKLTKKQTEQVLYGTKGKKGFPGLHGWFEKLQQKRHKMHVRVFLARYRGEFDCPDCGGSRLRPEAEFYRLNNRAVSEIWGLSLDDALRFFQDIAKSYDFERLAEIALDEVISRLQYLVEIGLGYLTLDRQSRSLSGGESQRVNLTSILGARLVNTLLVLDEPTIGLHQRDTNRLIRAVEALRDRGNSVLLVEHDTEVMRAADEIIDVGPKAGSHGGRIVYQGPVSGITECAESLTGKYLAMEAERTLPELSPPSRKNEEQLVIVGASAHNLKNIDVSIPLGKLVVLTGVSGSGKSTLLNNCLYEPYERLKQGLSLAQLLKNPNRPVTDIRGLDLLEEIVHIDQSPIGKTPRSNPATYTKAWDVIRDCLAETPEAQQLGLSKSAFSFNVDGGRCPVCSGAGSVRIEMQFLADVFIECEACSGARFQDKVLGVRFAGKNVVELLDMSLEDVVELFESLGEESRALKVLELLRPLIDLGLGYLRLGHPLSNVSGGEAQRIKLATYLSNKVKGPHLFILDEPTTGLHPHNIAQLIEVLRVLQKRGHTVLCVEHNLDVICQADWLIDLGPEGGIGGGEVVAVGTPYQLATSEKAAKSETARILRELLSAQKSKKQRRSTSKPEVQRLDASAADGTKHIQVLGARHHNLKDVSVSIPHNELNVITGVSGSGKSTLAFDIIFAEGQRRYIDCLSPYARQYIKQLTRAEVDRVTNIPPTIAISQKTSPPLGVSTIATTTELYQYMRLLYSKVGTQHCPVHDLPITGYSASLIAEEIASRYRGERVFLMAPVVSGRKGFYNDLFIRALKAELTEARIDGKFVKLNPELRLERHKLHWISLLIGSITAPEKNPEILREAIEQALLLGSGALEVIRGDKYGEPEVFSTARVCPKCKRGYRELDPQDFSFRSARGVCNTCGGRGVIEGSRKKNGAEVVCPDCGGARIGPIGRHVYLEGKSIFDLAQMTAPELLNAVTKLKLDPRLSPILEPIVRELKSRLKVICDVGLDYIALNRDASTISGGEAQRLRLAKTLGSPLTGVCYVLDEPSIGLHPKDQELLMGTLTSLRDAGNTVVVVEHDEETIRMADHVIDVGPRGGAGGGKIVAQGTVEDIEAEETSLTGQALKARRNRSGADRSFSSKNIYSKDRTWLQLNGARTNNLRNLNVEVPLGAFTVVVGVSGAGKSSLVHGSLVPAVVAELLGKKDSSMRTWAGLKNAKSLSRLVEIDQSPVGRTPTSTPASFLGIFDEIRKIYAALPEARARGWNPSYFSFNTGKGRCPECGGRGYIRVPMSFLPEATTICESCNGLRYTDHTLELLYQGISIGELLQRTMAEGKEILANHRTVLRSLEYISELGLGYLTLGQPTHTLSGGEAQRLKIAKELGLREAQDTLYILDEPTIGLHMSDVDKLLRVMHRLIDKGNTAVIIEHNLDVIQAADYVIEVGPGPGEAGGQLLFAGTPEELRTFRGVSPTRDALFATPQKSSSRARNPRPRALTEELNRTREHDL
ncbi:MAG: excinuclease ABC subunit UvrA [Bdellovibrionota bacterium]